MSKIVDRTMVRAVAIVCAVTALLASLLAHAQAPGEKQGLLATCPDKPNCVSSDQSEGKQKIEPFKIKGSPAEAWEGLKKAVSEMPRMTIVKATPTYLQIEARSRIFRFTDDLKFSLRPKEHLIAVRSASRAGYYDMAVNRERVEELREKLREQGLVE